MVGGLGGGKGKGRPGFGPPVNIARPNSLGDFNEVTKKKSDLVDITTLPPPLTLFILTFLMLILG